MRNIFFLIITLLLTLTLISCDKNEDDIYQSKEIVLGNKVDSVKITNSSGVEMNIDNSLDCYELYSFLNQFKITQKDKMFSYNSIIKLGENSKSYIQMNYYLDEFSEMFHFVTKKDGSDKIATIYEYDYLEIIENEGDNIGLVKRKEYEKYSYKNDLAFIGSETDENGTRFYKSNRYPNVPTQNSELADMQSRSYQLKNTLFSMNSLFTKYGSFEFSGKSYNLDELITSNYELYENYIILEQNNPFLLSSLNMLEAKFIAYQRALASKKSVNIKLYYNINTCEFEAFMMSGSCFKESIDVQLDIEAYIFDLDKTAYNEKENSLIDYVQEHSSN